MATAAQCHCRQHMCRMHMLHLSTAMALMQPDCNEDDIVYPSAGHCHALLPTSKGNHPRRCRCCTENNDGNNQASNNEGSTNHKQPRAALGRPGHHMGTGHVERNGQHVTGGVASTPGNWAEGSKLRLLSCLRFKPYVVLTLSQALTLCL